MRDATPAEQEALARRQNELECQARAEEASRRAGMWHHLLLRVGRRYERATLDTFEASAGHQSLAKGHVFAYIAQMPSNVQQGRNVLLYGPKGTGKDHLMVAMIREAVLTHGFGVHWINGLDFYGNVRDRIGSDKPEAELVKSICSHDILAISDPLPPWDDVGNFQAQMMFRIIDRRYRDLRPVWVTMNVAKGEEAEKRLGAATVDRLRDNALAIHCDWASHRRAAT